jgi:hypothetical protein
MSTNIKIENRGGYRPNAGRKKIENKEKNKGIFVQANVFKILNAQKKQLKSKSWTAFLVDKLGIK